MPATIKSESHGHAGESSFISLLTGWAQQGVQSFFATQRILLDLAMRQNANMMQALRQHLTDPHHSPAAILSEAAGEGVNHFIEGQKILLDLGKQQNEILMNGVEDHMGDWPAALAMTDMLRRSVDTFVRMQQEFLKIAGKQAHSWMEAAKAGKPYQGQHMAELAREGLENFVNAQKEFLDIVAEEAAKTTGGKRTNGMRKMKKSELSQVAREATESLIEAQKKLVDLAGRQMNANVKNAAKAMEVLKPFPFLPLAELTREGVKSYVDAQKALMEVMTKPTGEHKASRPMKRPVRKAAAAAA